MLSKTPYLPQEESQGRVGLCHREPELVCHGLELELLLGEVAAKRRPVLVARLFREQLRQVPLRIPEYTETVRGCLPLS